ncbi:MAG: CDP-alcohol phosphatidyltransferase family protein [Atopobiaceae bacterium]|jgi:CDP-diacylglycerol--glycerol-3-phosphate 3-phosphatidyltransferase|nr:CDP-alcohol phosphatidyltransferase family protein [Atopobiaceae bacterium]
MRRTDRLKTQPRETADPLSCLARVRAILPDAITISRIAVAPALLLLAPFGTPWFAAFLWCGASDVLDGALARRWRHGSRMGARLDSLSDAVFTLVLLIVLVPLLEWHVWMVVWVIAIAVVRLFSIVTCRLRFGTASLLHTYANKACGVVLFVSIALIPWLGQDVPVVVSCMAATLSALEELVLMATMRMLDLDRASILVRKQDDCR